jgi:hypothetical protein
MALRNLCRPAAPRTKFAFSPAGPEAFEGANRPCASAAHERFGVQGLSRGEPSLYLEHRKCRRALSSDNATGFGIKRPAH